MMARLERVVDIETPRSVPEFELRVRGHGLSGVEFEVWQLPSTATPQVARPTRISGLKGRNLQLVEHRVLKRLAAAGVVPGVGAEKGRRSHRLSEDLALNLGLLFRVLAPMRSRDNMRAVAEGVEAMGREEAAYWLGMGMHRKNPRRVLTALRVLMTMPRRKAQ